MRLNLLALSLASSVTLLSGAAFAEPAVQAGETVESLSKAKISTTVNGQPGSINDVLSQKGLKLLNEGSSASATAQPSATSVSEVSQEQSTQVEPAATIPATEDVPAQAPQQADPIIEN